MQRLISADDKFDVQQNFRRYMRLQDAFDSARDSYKRAKASRVWIVGIILLLFALASDFFLGAAAGLFGVYFYNVVTCWLDTNSCDEGIEDLDRWFAGKGLKFEGRVLHFKDDEMLENPLDPFCDGCYNVAE